MNNSKGVGAAMLRAGQEKLDTETDRDYMYGDSYTTAGRNVAVDLKQMQVLPDRTKKTMIH